MDRFNRRDGIINSISLKDIDDSNEWLTGRMEGSRSPRNMDDDDDDGGGGGGGGGGGDDDFVHLGHDLSWNVVGRASGAEDPERLLRSNSSHQNRMPSSSNSRKKGKAVVSSSRAPPPALHDSEEEVDIYLEQPEEEYVSDGDKSMDGDDDEDIEEDEDLDDDLDDD